MFEKTILIKSYRSADFNLNLQWEVVNRTSPHQHAVWVCVLRGFGMCTVLGVKPHQFADVCFLVEGYAFSKDPEKHVAQKHCNGHAIRIDHLSHCGFSGITSQKLDNCKGIIRKSLE